MSIEPIFDYTLLGAKFKMRLPWANAEHFGIIVCTNDPDRPRMATRSSEAIAASESLQGQLIRVVRPPS